MRRRSLLTYLTGMYVPLGIVDPGARVGADEPRLRDRDPGRAGETWGNRGASPVRLRPHPPQIVSHRKDVLGRLGTLSFAPPPSISRLTSSHLISNNGRWCQSLSRSHFKSGGAGEVYQRSVHVGWLPKANQHAVAQSASRMQSFSHGHQRADVRWCLPLLGLLARARG